MKYLDQIKDNRLPYPRLERKLRLCPNYQFEYHDHRWVKCHQDQDDQVCIL